MKKAGAASLLDRLLMMGVLMASAGTLLGFWPTSAAIAATWQRSVMPAGRGPQRLEVDAALLMASVDGTLRDLRLVDDHGREIPYLLMPPPTMEGTWLKGRMLPINATKEESGFEMDLGRPVSTSRLRLEGMPEPFLKRFRLEGSGDRQHWTVLIAEGTIFSLPDEGLRQMEASFAFGEYRYLRITWYDGQSQRLPLPNAAMVYQAPAGASPVAPSVEVAFARRISEPRVSRYRLRLPGKLPISALILDVGGGHLLRRVQVLEAHLRNGALQPVPLGEAVLKRTVHGNAVAEALVVPLALPEEQELELQVQDDDNQPLELRGVRAQLLPQPWIYLESPGAEMLIAHLGDQRLQAPHYDLEAMREKLRDTRLAWAKWGDAPALDRAAMLAEKQLDPGPGGALDPSGFKVKRLVPLASPGLSALLLDAEVLAQSDLADIRLANGAGQQVPYLLERRDEPLVLELKISGQTTRDRLTTYAVDLPVPGLPASRMVLETSARVFERPVQILEDLTGIHREGEPSEHLLAEATWRHADPETASMALFLPLAQLSGSRILVRVDEGDNQPLAITAVRLLLPSWRLRFFHPGTPLTLLYGQQNLRSPRYDLALLAPRLRAAPAQEIALSPSSTGVMHRQASVASVKYVFWGVLVVAVAALLVLLSKLLGNATPNNGH